MADEKTVPTEEQIKAANEAEDARWGEDFSEDELKIPYKRGNDDGDSNDNNATNTGDGKDGNGTVDETGIQEVLTDPAPVITVTDPGEYKAADYSFDASVKDGKIIKISTPEEAERLADDPENFETPKQLMDFINKQNKMARSLERDYEKWEAQHETFTSQVATEQERRDNIETFVSEFDYLADKGLTPKLSPALKNADWSDPEIAKDADVKVYNDILDYFVKENTARVKAGIKPMTSMIDAFNTMQADTARTKAIEAKANAGVQRKAAGARVAGVSASGQEPYVPKGIAVGRVMPQRGAAVWDN